MRVAWDIDGTLYFNCLELDFFGYVDRWGGRDKILPFNFTNSMVCPRDVRHVLTFRPEWWRKATREELKKHGFNPGVLLMNPSETDIYANQSVVFKAAVLNRWKYDVYVDNDDILRRNLQPLTTTRCVSVEEFYILGLNNSGV
jgi:hypothetical protein